jgi:hypothetical protein
LESVLKDRPLIIIALLTMVKYMKRLVCSPALIPGILLIAALLVLPVSGVAPLNTTIPATTTAMMPGSDRDSHGCIGSAGYTWCDTKQTCLRTWEEPCTAESAPPPATPVTAATRALLPLPLAIAGITFACGLAVLVRKR